MTGIVDGIDLSLLDPGDEDDRRLLIEADHPELHKALVEGAEEVRQGSRVVNPRLHISMHEVVANQLWADDPPDVWRTARRLTAAGYERHDVLHMLASVVSDEVWQIMTDKTPADLARMSTRLAALPGSWEELREDVPTERARNRAERRAEERRRHRRF